MNRPNLVSFSSLASLASIFSQSECRGRQQRHEVGSARRRRQRKALWERGSFNGIIACHWCACKLTREAFTRDHLIALCLGGRDVVSNMVAACFACNQRRGMEQARLINEMRLEWEIAKLRSQGGGAP